MVSMESLRLRPESPVAGVPAAAALGDGSCDRNSATHGPTHHGLGRGRSAPPAVVLSAIFFVSKVPTAAPTIRR